MKMVKLTLTTCCIFDVYLSTMALGGRHTLLDFIALCRACELAVRLESILKQAAQTFLGMDCNQTIPTRGYIF